MLIINRTEYNCKEKYIDFDLFEGVVDGKKRKCKVLYITLITENFKIGIETSYGIDWIKEIKVNDKKDISKYIIGLPYEDKNGWIYLTDKCNCTLCRIDGSLYEIELNGFFEECDEEFDIKYKDKLYIK